ncbi:hypothetical protein PTKIN_Ptkin19aG0135800 [Pterospermum kingtungense]
MVLSGGKYEVLLKNGWNCEKKSFCKMEVYLSYYFCGCIPSFLPPPLAGKGKESEKKKEEERLKEKEKGKSRNIYRFMEELKHEQEMRERRNQEDEQRRDGHHHDSPDPSSRFDELPDDFDPSGKLPGSFDDGDPQTTTLYVGNLSTKCENNVALDRGGEETAKKLWFCGFHEQRQAAKDEMQGVVVSEYELKIMWGISVALPSQALPAPPPGQMAIRSKEGGSIILSGPSGPPVTSVPNQDTEPVLTPDFPDIVVIPPEDRHLRFVINTMALYVLDGGCAFEQAITERGRGNRLFSFLFELGSKEHAYYGWRLYSFAQGDTLQTYYVCRRYSFTQRWWTEPFIMITGSGRWVPPPLPTTKDPEHEKDSTATYAAGRSRRVEQERTPQRDEFEDMLRALTLERSQIKEAIDFALDNADAAGEILLIYSLIKFQAFVTGRITAEALKERVLKALQYDWFLFSDAYVNGLRFTFLRSGNSGVPPFHSICGDVPEIEKKTSSEDAVDGIKANQDAALAMGKSAAMKELMDLPLERKGSVPLVESLTLPQPELKAFTNKDKIDPVLPASKWAREDDDSDDEEKRSSQGLGLSYSSSGSENSGDGPSKADEFVFGTDVNTPAPSKSAMSEEQMQKLRRLEVALIEYRESLEEQGSKNAEDIERRVAAKRKQLESEYGLSVSGENFSGRSKLFCHLTKRTLDRRKSWDDLCDSSRKRHRSPSRSVSPQQKSSKRDKDRENDQKRTEKGAGIEIDLMIVKKGGSRERYDHDRDRGRERWG